MEQLFTPDTFPGDEDTGSMAAWYLLSAMGFYPVCPGKPEYVLGSPLFDRMTLNLPDGKRTVIETHGQGKASVYVSKVLIDNDAHTSSTVSHEQIVGGSRLEFFLQSTPSEPRAERS
jgi:putative alpha-1,2-mannosidase